MKKGRKQRSYLVLLLSRHLWRRRFVSHITREIHVNVEQIMGVKSRTFDTATVTGVSSAPAGKHYRVKLTDKERKKVEAMIKNAKSLEDIIRLEKELNEGRVPVGAQGDDAMEE
jgi:vacuolar-type H+-ATPase subunit D/Vma8